MSIQDLKNMPVYTAPPKRNRAEEIINEISNRYRFTKQQVKGKNLSLDILCFASGIPVKVNSLYAIKDHCICVEGTGKDDSTVITYAPVEQVTFQIIVAKAPTEQPAREIGFHTSKGEEKE